MSNLKSLWRKFYSLTEEEQRDANRNFEKKMQEWLDENFYPDYGKVDRSKETDKHDLLLLRKEKSYDVEEKFRKTVYNDFLLELLGDVKPPLIDFSNGKFVHQKIGWFYYCDADMVVYAMADSPIAETPTKIYIVNMRRLKKLFPQLIKDKMYNLVPINTNGIGYSLNIGIPWDVLIDNKVAMLKYEKAPPEPKN